MNLAVNRLDLFPLKVFVYLYSKWHSVAVKGVTLIEALRCWEGSQETTNRPRQAQLPPYPWSTSSFEVPDLSELEDIASEEAVTNDIRHFSRKLDKERRRSRSMCTHRYSRM